MSSAPHLLGEGGRPAVAPVLFSHGAEEEPIDYDRLSSGARLGTPFADGRRPDRAGDAE